MNPIFRPDLRERIAVQHRAGLAWLTSKLESAGYQAWIVGGAVRDLLMNITPVEFDFATDAHPEAVIKIFPKTFPTGLAHGTITVMVRLEGGQLPCEVTTFRSEFGYSDGRRPDEIRYETELEADLSRRDFTMNGIAWNFHSGELRDPFGGCGDIEARRIKAIGEPTARFREDGLRAVRAYRFKATLGFSLDEGTEVGIAQTLDVCRKVAVERFFDEWRKAANRGRLAEFVFDLFKSRLWNVFILERGKLPLNATPASLGLDRVSYPAFFARTFDGINTGVEQVSGWQETLAYFLHWDAPLLEESAPADLESCYEWVAGIRNSCKPYYGTITRDLKRPTQIADSFTAIITAVRAAQGFAGGRQKLFWKRFISIAASAELRPLLRVVADICRVKKLDAAADFLSDCARNYGNGDGIWKVSEIQANGQDLQGVVTAAGRSKQLIGVLQRRLLDAVQSGGLENRKGPLLAFCMKALEEQK